MPCQCPEITSDRLTVRLPACLPIANAELGGRFERTIVAFMDLVEAAKHYPCAKKAWVEFLGEHPNPLIDRVE